MLKNFNIILNILKRQSQNIKLRVVLEKFFHKFWDKKGSISVNENIYWIKENCNNFRSFAKDLDLELWKQAEDKVNEIKNRSKEILSNLEIPIGGGGIYPLLYFLTKKFNPEIIIETGVAAGYSSNAFLAGMHENQKGTLFSSDLPYLRESNPEKYIGLLVEEKYKYRWRLFLKGDSENIKEIKKEIKSVDFFHYDSDKSYLGRQKTLYAIKPLLKKNSILLIDDIQDNCFFHDLVLKEDFQNWYIFEFEKKYCGLIFYNQDNENI